MLLKVGENHVQKFRIASVKYIFNTFLFILGLSYWCSGQDRELSLGFKDYYPIHSKPNIGYLSSMNEFEDIIFDAKPVVYYSFWNNMQERIKELSNRQANAIYVLFLPHLRMYNEASLPVKTPSYKAGLGWQQLRKLENDDFFSFAVESGHYSNGQSGCAFARRLVDGTLECNAVLSTIDLQSNLSQLLNRSNGNFSTNWTKASLNYRINTFRSNGRPRVAHSVSASWELYHRRLLGLIDIGGYSDFDINIYGRNRFKVGYEFVHTYNGGIRYSAACNFTYINKPHPWVEPWRFEATGILYLGNKDFGIYGTYIRGHDNYNYRFVDSGEQFGIGIVWDWFAPVDRASAKLLDRKEEVQR